MGVLMLLLCCIFSVAASRFWRWGRKFRERSERNKILTPHFRSPGGTFNLPGHIFFSRNRRRLFPLLHLKTKLQLKSFHAGPSPPFTLSPPLTPHPSRWGDMYPLHAAPMVAPPMHIPPAGVHKIAFALARALKKKAIAKMKISLADRAKKIAYMKTSIWNKLKKCMRSKSNGLVESLRRPPNRGGGGHIILVGGGPTGVWVG